MASNSQAKWLVFGRDFTVRTITMETDRFFIFFLSPETFKLSEIQKVSKSGILFIFFITTVQLQQAEVSFTCKRSPFKVY